MSKGSTLRLEPKMMQVLVYLADHEGSPVTKKDLLTAVWPDTFVTDDVLVRAVSELRRVLGDDAHDPHIIQTIPKRGYRLLVPVKNAVAADTRTGFAALQTNGFHPWKARSLVLAAASLATVVMIASSALKWNTMGLRDAALPEPQSIPVLPPPTRSVPEARGLATSSHAVNPRAVEAYLQGRSHHQKILGTGAYLGQRDKFERELNQALQGFQQAIAEDPNYALAYLGIAEAAMGPARYRHPYLQMQQTARSAVLKALEIDPNLAQAHLDMARVEFWSWNWDTAEREFKRAIELDPENGKGHELYGEYLEATGRREQGRLESQRSQALDPGNRRMEWLFYLDRQFDQFIELMQTDVLTGASGAMAHFDLGYGYERAGRYKQAVREWEKAMTGFGYPQLATALRRGYTTSGFNGAMHNWVAGWEVLAQKGEPVYPEIPAYIYAILGEHDRAFAWLERGFRVHSSGMPFLAIDPTWDDIRTDARFAELVRRVGVPTPGTASSPTLGTYHTNP